MKSRKYLHSYEKFITKSFVAFAVLIVTISYITAFNPSHFSEETLLFLDSISSDLLSPLLLGFLFFLLSDYFDKFQK